MSHAAFVFRVGVALPAPLSPAAADIRGVNYLSAMVDSVIAVEEGAKMFGVKLTGAEEFLRRKAGLAG